MSQYLAPVADRYENAVQVEVGEAVPRRGNRITHIVAVWILALSGWRLTGELPDLPKFLIVGAPHTSNWDMVWGILTMYALGLRISFMAKHALFYPPYGWFFRWLGGVKVDRRKSQGLVEQTIDAYRSRESLVLAILPEGSRRRVARWKTGFYHIAAGADIPIVPLRFDYGRRELEFGPTFYATGDIGADLPQIQANFRGVRGKYPENYGL